MQIVGDGVDPKAVAACEVFITQLIGNNPAAQEALKKANVAIVIIPHDKKMTDLPQFAALAGTNTFDGRLWDNVRGSGGMTAPDGTFALAVGGTTPLASLTTNANGTTRLGGGATMAVSTTGTQSYNDAVVLLSNTTLSAAGGASTDITLASTVNGAFSLDVNTQGTGSFQGNVGGTTP